MDEAQPQASLAATDSSVLPLADNEKRILDLYDRLQQLQLEVALINAQNNYQPRPTPQNREAAEDALLDSRARYVLRNEIAESVMSSKPVLRAVHGGSRASPIERDLAPLLRSRDNASTTLSLQSTSLRGTLDTLTSTEADTLRLSKQNAESAAEVLELATEAKRYQAEAVSDPAYAEEIAQLEADVRTSRRRWRVMKATASAIVAGSGVDWARDDELRAIVLDEDEDGV